MEEEKGYLSFTREELLGNLELLDCIYKLNGKDNVINWVLKKPQEEEVPHD